MELENYNQEEFETLLTESVLVASGTTALYTGDGVQTLGAGMLAAAVSPAIYGGILAVRKFRNRNE